ncbi:MAG: orotidine-5'-phosphate decarboxylase [Alphaproteobacteria bacterium]|nr:orotidine-5'-phosphate decarboxylase [Alphaproteobacteria bacterium]MDP7222362.1 orotidine-5'-phosphate decarboxylase [Alphaproteobacteria bacterium]
MTDTKIYCALDTDSLDHALDMAGMMEQASCGLKLGMEFFNAQGPQGIAKIRAAHPDAPLFVDLKYHDIPNTVAGAVRAISQLEPAYINVHATGGRAMMRAAQEAMESVNNTTKLLAVTILTSMDESDLADIGMQTGTADRVRQLAKLTQDCGLAGIVCSSHEIEAVRAVCGPDFALMVPGIRPAGSAAGDQKRIMTPKDALDKGATHLVIGRPITQADDPLQAARDILATL